tara:strand:+ start:288 stop:1490 length:1203 start_codon:yes stop_codon:yes gene_type:complete
MSIDTNVDQTTKKTEIKSVVIKNTTSPEEKRKGSQNWIIICNVKEILKFDLSKNLRISYGDAIGADGKRIKNRNAIHKAIYSSFEDSPERFIQRNSGFTVVCDELKQNNKEEYGINTISLSNASLINGAQTQGEIRRYFEENGEAFVENLNNNTNIRIEVIVEKDQHEVHEISVARNSSTNVSDLSKLGNMGYFKDMNQKMIDELGEDKTLQQSETSDGVPTQTLLQILRAMTPKFLKEDNWSKDMVIAYSGKGKCLTDYGKMYEAEEKSKKDNSSYSEPILDFYREFCPEAWRLYEKWVSDPDWIPYWKKSDGYKKIGKYNEKDGSFELTWAIVCPLLFGLQEFIEEGTFNYDEPQGFDKKKYMDTIMSEFKDHKFIPQEFAKDKSTYLILRDAILENR